VSMTTKLIRIFPQIVILVTMTACSAVPLPWGFGRGSDGFAGPMGVTQQPIILWENRPEKCVVPAGSRYRLAREPVDPFDSQPKAESGGRSRTSGTQTVEEQAEEINRQFASHMPVGESASFKIVKLPEVITEDSVQTSTGSVFRRNPRLSVPPPLCDTDAKGHATYAQLFEPRNPEYTMALRHSTVGIYTRTTGNGRVQLEATAVGPRTSESTISTYRVDAIFALVTGDGTVVIGSDVYPEYLATSMKRTSGSRSDTTNMLVSANELANTRFVLFAEKTCNWGVSLGTLEWINNCHNYWGNSMTRPPRGALSTRLTAEKFVGAHLTEMRSSAVEPGRQYSIAGWNVMRVR
jgi:hypothetical protein